MNYHQYYPIDVVNGPGTRCTLFVAGCVHQCPGCYNKSTWRLNSGQPFTPALEDRIIADLNDTRVPRQGLSLSGGDPLHPANVPSILQLVNGCAPSAPAGYLAVDRLPAGGAGRTANAGGGQNQRADRRQVRAGFERPGADLARQQQPGGA